MLAILSLKLFHFPTTYVPLVTYLFNSAGLRSEPKTLHVLGKH